MKKIVAIVAIIVALSPTAHQQQPSKASSGQLPPLSYVCTMPGDEDVIEDKPGKCRKCGMQLVPVRLDTVWTCATRPLLVVESTPGKCPVDGTPLVQVTAAVSWTCKSQPSLDKLEPGTCPDGSAMIKRYAARAHGNHNPQHGGLFFMAPDNWHHVEGAYLPTGVFRLYLYDDFTKPLAADQVQQVTARIVTKQTFDPATRTTRELAAVPLVRKGRYLEASIGKLPLPAQMTAKVSFKRGSAENVFDFAFDKFSAEPAPAPHVTSAAAATTPARPAAIGASAPPAPAPAAAAPPAPSTAVVETVPTESSLTSVNIPETVPEILAQLRARTNEIRTLVDRGSFGSVYVPAFQAKDLALALDEHRDQVKPDRRQIAGPAVKQLVRAAYLLDAFGDLGNKQQILDAYALFDAAMKEIESSYPEP